MVASPMQGARRTRTASHRGRQRRMLQGLAAGQLAADAVADPHGQRRRRRFVLLDHVEVRVEGRDFIDFGLRQPHFRGERQVASAETEPIL